MTRLDDCDTFKDYGHSGKAPSEYKEIRVHLIFAVKHDGRHQSRQTRCLWRSSRIGTSGLLDKEGIQQCQSLISAMQWALPIGRIDNTTAVMTLSSSRSTPPEQTTERTEIYSQYERRTAMHITRRGIVVPRNGILHSTERVAHVLNSNKGDSRFLPLISFRGTAAPDSPQIQKRTLAYPARVYRQVRQSGEIRWWWR
jgi:hypothetical protein